ncbi:MAG TPA: ATP-dependent DNA ligase [Thermoplasmata archaeon]|nr:ATP-dependent DNA ligase [Thermoplasmata archaeon]
MLYRQIVDTYVELEGTTKRLEMIALLADLLGATPAGEMTRVVYLTQGRVRPQFRGGELGLADKLVVRAIAMATGLSEGDVREEFYGLGDLGLACERALERKVQTALFTEDLTVERVHGNLERIVSATGANSQDLKMKLVADLLHSAAPVEGRYLVRTILGRLRLGVGDMTIIDAIARAFDVEREPLERAYNIHPDLGEIAGSLATEGVAGLERFTIEAGIPVHCMLAERLPSVAEIIERMEGQVAFEYKYDGVRVQVHILPDGEIELFSRQLERITDQYPDVVSHVADSGPETNSIIEGECVPIHPETGEMLPFQVVSRRRRRKHDLDRAMEEVPVSLILFDCLLAGGADMMDRPYPERREALQRVISFTERVRLASSLVTSDPDEAARFFDEAIEHGCEGIVAKSTASDSIYRAGSRGFLWIKYKRDYRVELTDTLDLVPVGAYRGRGKRSGVFGALLMAAYDRDSDTFETVCRLGTGFDDETLREMVRMMDAIRLERRHPRVRSRLDADVWLEPRYVMEVSGAEITQSPVHTCALGRNREGIGLAVRFPRFTGRWRDDRAPEDATTTEEIVGMYERQVKTS